MRSASASLSHFLARRLVFVLVLGLVASSAALVLTRLAPGDVTSQLGPTASQREIADLRQRYDLDRSLASQWALWVSRATRFDFGRSFLYNRPVAPLVLAAALNTAVLALFALLTATLLGVGSGILTGANRGALPAMVRAASLVCLSLPPLLTSLVLVFIAARTGWLPAGGMSSAAAGELPWAAWVVDRLRYLPLPVLALSIPLAATFEQIQSQALREALRQPFVVAALARGVSPRDVVTRHAWRASLRPLCGIYGLAVGTLLSGSFIVEYVTAWPGLGRLMYEGLRARDIYLVAGCAAMGSMFLALGTVLSDLLLYAADPRVREESQP